MKAILVHAPAPVYYIGAYGSECVQTPALDRLATAGIVFDAHEADSCGPLQILEALSTGRHSFAAGSGAPAFLDRLREMGVATILLSSRSDAKPTGWSQVESLPGETRLSRIRDESERILNDLAERSDWLFVLDLVRIIEDEEPTEQEPEEVEADEDEEVDEESDEDQESDDEDPEEEEPDKFVEGIEDEVDAELQAILANQAAVAADVEDLDSFIDWLTTELSERSLQEEVLFIFTGPPVAVEGDSLCSAGPPHPLRPSRTRLPLIMRLPGGAHAGRRASALTQPVDLPATFLALLKQPLPPDFHGRNLLPPGANSAARSYAVAIEATEDGSALALSTRDWKLLVLEHSEHEPERWLFRQPEDRFGVNDFYQQHLDFADRLESFLHHFQAAASQPGLLAAPDLPIEHETNPAEK
jgi:hypothetical protein